MIKKLLFTAAFAVLAAGAAMAADGTVSIGSSFYNSLADAVGSAVDGQTITVAGTIEVSSRIILEKEQVYNIEGLENATIKMTNKGQGMFLIRGNASVNFKSLTLDGNNLELTNNKPVEVNNAAKAVTFTDCKVVNFNMSKIDNPLNQRVIFVAKNTTINGLTAENCTLANAVVVVGKNNGLTVAGASNYSVYLEGANQYAINAGENLSGDIDLKLDTYTADKVIVKGTTDASVFTLVGAPEGYSLKAKGTDLVLAYEKMVVKNETTGKLYSSLLTAVGEAAANEVLVVLESIELGARILNTIDNLTIMGASADVVITKTYKNALFMAADKRNLIIKDLVLDCNNMGNDKNELEAGGAHLTLENVVVKNSVTTQNIVNVKTGKTLYVNNLTQEGSENAANGINLIGKMELKGNLNLNVKVANTAAGAITVTGELTNEQPIELTLANTELGSQVVKGTTDYKKFTLTNPGLFLNVDADNNSLVLSNEKQTGISDITVDENAPVEYYNLQGVRVANPEAGLYIRRQGGKAEKVYVK